jgi:hypothetical protein
VDEQFLEATHFIHLLCKGNVNMVWATLTPIAYYQTEFMVRVRNAISGNLAKSMFPSIFGMAESQWRDSVKRSGVRDPIKSKSTAIRTLMFGLNATDPYLSVINPVEWKDYTAQEYEELCSMVHKKLESSRMPDHMPTSALQDLLYMLKLQQIQLAEYQEAMVYGDLWKKVE